MSAYANSQYSILSSQTLFSQTPQLGNFGIIQCMVTASTPIAAVYNGQLELGEFISMLQSQSGADGVSFGQINEVYQFNLYKVIKAKVIYARYTSRVLPDQTQSQYLNTNGFYPSIQFKIDYDACCVGQMSLLMTTDISVKDSQDPVVINGYSANGVKSLQVNRSDIQSIQIAYGNDFVYNFLDKISIGFCNTGGSTISWHQEVPSEIAKIYHSIIEDPGMSQTIKRMVREDVFTIQHNPYHQYGEFSFALKADNALASQTSVTSTNPQLTYTRQAIDTKQYQAGFNEIAMYWVDAKIKEINFNRDQYSQYQANGQNWQIGLPTVGGQLQPQMSNIKVIDGATGTQKYLAAFDLTYISKIYFGTTDTVYTLQLPNDMETPSNMLNNESATGTITANCLTYEGELDTQISGTYTTDVEVGSDGKLEFPSASSAIRAGGVAGKYHLIASCEVQDRTGVQLTPESSSSSGFYSYKLTQNLIAPIPLYITTQTAWANASERLKILTKLEQLIDSGVYPEFYLNILDESGQPHNSSIYYIPFIILDIKSTLYQFCTCIYKKGSSKLYAQIGLNVQLTKNDISYESKLYLRELRLAATTGSGASTAFYVQNVNDDTYNLPSMDITDTYSFATIGFNQGLEFLTKTGNKICRSLFIYTKYYDGNTEDNNYIIIPGFVGRNKSDVTVNQDIYAINIANGASGYVQIQNSGAFPYLSYSLLPDNLAFQSHSYGSGSNTSTFFPDLYWNTPPFYRFITQFDTLSGFVDAVQSEVQSIAFKSTGAVSPYLNAGSFNTMNLEIEKYDENDYALNGLAWYYTINSNNQPTYDRRPYPQEQQQKYDVFRFNAAMLHNHENEEFRPSLMNQDYMSIHTYREKIGCVDFYLPLSFLFICQGIRNSFPHYACSAQSIVLKFDFINPLSLMNVSMAVNPTAIDPLDFSKDARIFVNRFNNLQILQNNINNNGNVLFYQRYQWIPEVLDVITEYQFYQWVTKNYERQRKYIYVNQLGSFYDLYTYTRSVFYTKIWCFVVSKETLSVMEFQGGYSNILPLEVNKYSLPVWDVLNYDFQNTQQANSYNGNEVATFNAAYNSVYSYIPFESVKIETNSNLQMSDDMPFRFQMFNDYVMLDHTQVHSALEFNNLLQFNLDPVYYQEDAPNALYSPAYAPQFRILYKPKNTLSQVEQYGVIMVSECVNISFIKDHLILCKYLTN